MSSYTESTTTSNATSNATLKPFDAYIQTASYSNNIPDSALIDWVNNETDNEIHSLSSTILIKSFSDNINTYCTKLIMNNNEVMSVSLFIKNDIMHKLMQRVIPTFCPVEASHQYALISFNRNIFKNGIDTISSGLNYSFKYNDDRYCKFGLFNTICQAHEITKVNKTSEIYSNTTTIVGYIWSNLGIMVLDLWHGHETNPQSFPDHAALADTMLQTVSNGEVSGDADWTNIKSKNLRKLRTYFVRIPHNRFNKSTNSTWTSSTSFYTSNTTYITGIGLYSGNTLLAIAKLNKPIKKNNEKEYNIQIKIDMTGN